MTGSIFLYIRRKSGQVTILLMDKMEQVSCPALVLILPAYLVNVFCEVDQSPDVIYPQYVFRPLL